MWINLVSLKVVIKKVICFSTLSCITFACYIPLVIASEVTGISIDQANGRVSWVADGMAWNASVQLDSYFGESIPIIDVDLATGNDTAERESSNCYYRGTLADANWGSIANTHAFINLCHGADLFTGFVSNELGVYVIEKDPSDPSTVVMERDDPMTPLTTPNETNTGNNGGNGSGQLLKPDFQYARSGSPDKFPSVEIFVEPSFVNMFGDPGFIHRIATTLAFVNFFYQQSGLKQIHLISINVLNDELNRNGGQGAVRHQMYNLRRSTVQEGSGDASVLMVGGDIDSTYLWGWALDGSACELQIALEEGDKLDTREIGRSSAFVIDLPSLIQRGWIFSHEFGHLIGASKHIKDDPLMDGWFQYIDSLSRYVAGCDAVTQLFHSCTYDSKSRKVTDFYSCGE